MTVEKLDIILMLMIYAFTTFFVVLFSASTHFDFISKRNIEIYNWYYSFSTFLIFVIVYQIIYEIFLAFLTLLLAIFIYGWHGYHACILFLLSPFFIQPFCFLIGSLASNSILSTIYSCFAGILVFFPTFITAFILLYLEHRQKFLFVTVRKIDAIQFFSSPVLFINAITYLFLDTKVDFVFDTYFVLNFFNGIKVEYKLAFLISIILTILSGILGFLVLCRKIPMNIRMKMENQ